MKPIKQTTIDRYAAIFLAIAIILLAYSGFILHKNMIEIDRAVKYQEKILMMANDMEDISNKLSDLARSIANNYNIIDLNEYWYEVNIERTKDRIISELIDMNIPEEESIYLINAKKRSDDLEKVEMHSMSLISNAMNYDSEQIPSFVSEYILTEEEKITSKQEKIDLARKLVFEQQYRDVKKEIRTNISQFRNNTEQRIAGEINIAVKSSNDAFNLQKIFLVFTFIGGFIILLFYYTQTALPVINYTTTIKENSKIGELPKLVPKGSIEVRKLAEAFNKNTEERLKMEASLIETENKLKLHIHLMPLAAIEYDYNFVITHWNKAAEKIFGFTKEEAVGRHCTDIIIPKIFITEIQETISKLRAGDSTVETNVNKNITKDGKILICEWYNTPIYDLNNNIIGWLSLGKDITSEREKQDEILYLSQHDYLTRLYNRGYIMEQLEIENARFKRTGKEFSVIILDIDFFKQVNDNYGHEAGDQVLKKISDIMSSTVRQTDFVGRWGGEEFVIVLPFTDTEGAYTLAEKIRKSIEDEEIIYKDKLVKITITAGVSCCCKAYCMANCISIADEALLKGKATGRNKVVKMGC